MNGPKKGENKSKKVLRRDFLVGSGTAIAAGALTAVAPASASAAASPAATVSYEPSEGYIVYDSRLCLGCQSCMYACSMTHEGEANPSLSRIQIIRDAPSFTKYPYDIVMSVCRQCVTPICVQNCPAGACHDRINQRRVVVVVVIADRRLVSHIAIFQLRWKEQPVGTDEIADEPSGRLTQEW